MKGEPRLSYRRFTEEEVDIAKVKLTAKELKVLCLRHGLFGAKMNTLEDIGLVVDGLSKERIRQIEARAASKVRGAHPVCLHIWVPIGKPEQRNSRSARWPTATSKCRLCRKEKL